MPVEKSTAELPLANITRKFFPEVSRMWYEIENTSSVTTPSVVVFLKRVQKNISKMLAYVKSPQRLCPHVKTHKTREVLQFYLDAGVRQFKCATLAELQMVTEARPDFALLAMPCLGPAPQILVQIANHCPDVEVGCVVDSMSGLDTLAQATTDSSATITVMLDIDNGMGRTGIRVGDEAAQLYEAIQRNPQLRVGGLHVYDGHVHDQDLVTRRINVEAAMAPVLAFREQLLAAGAAVPRLITGGTPSFPVHADREDRICSPGTTIFWDAGYAKKYPDMEFLPAAVLLTRVISKLPDNRYCLDLGHKSVAAEMQPPRASFLNCNVKSEVTHSEEHLVVELGRGETLQVGDVLYALPKHICPTIALHDRIHVADEGRIVSTWCVTSRNRHVGDIA